MTQDSFLDYEVDIVAALNQGQKVHNICLSATGRSGNCLRKMTTIVIVYYYNWLGTEKFLQSSKNLSVFAHLCVQDVKYHGHLANLVLMK